MGEIITYLKSCFHQGELEAEELKKKQKKVFKKLRRKDDRN